ncbi:MAG: Lrp/AsnC family transcriptional regulator [Pseudonocardiaceae bacterium]
MREILDVLQQDAHATPDRIAALTGLPVEEVHARIATWEEAGVIRRYKAVVDWGRLRATTGTEQITAFIDVSVTPSRGVGFHDVAARISRFPEVRSVYLVSGAQDLRCVVTGASMHDVADFVAQKLSSLERVQATATHFVLKTYKEDGDSFLEPEPDHRLRVAP